MDEKAIKDKKAVMAQLILTDEQAAVKARAQEMLRRAVDHCAGMKAPAVFVLVGDTAEDGAEETFAAANINKDEAIKFTSLAIFSMFQKEGEVLQ